MNDNFLQSQPWADFQKALGRKSWIIKTENIEGLVIKYSLPFKKSYLYCPYGPIFYEKNYEVKLRSFLDEVKKIAKQENAIFFRCDPKIDLKLEDFGFKKAPHDYYFSATAMPKEVAILDISINEEDIFKNMHPKTRYNIKLAERKGIKIEKVKDIDIFYDLICKTSRREKIKSHIKEHYQNLLEIFGENICLFLAFLNKKPVAGIMVLFFGKTATYLHGGSDLAYKNLMAPHLLQWSAIKEARKRGCQEYDFGGISSVLTHPWSGITRFKLSFGAKPTIYPGAYDLIFQPVWYWLYNLIRGLK